MKFKVQQNLIWLSIHLTKRDCVSAQTFDQQKLQLNKIGTQLSLRMYNILVHEMSFIMNWDRH